MLPEDIIHFKWKRHVHYTCLAALDR
jgi:hypothetical protein